MNKGSLLVYSIILLSVIGISIRAIHAAEKYVAQVDDDGIQRIKIVGGSYYFKPDHIVVRNGIPVQFKIVKDSLIVPHNLIIEKILDGKDISETMSRDEKVISVTPSNSGIYNFYCDKKLPFLKSHRDRGMKGIIEVVE